MNIALPVLGLIIVNVLFSLQGFNNQVFFDKYKFQIGAVNRGEKYRMLTSGFLHVDYMHLILNMYVLYIFSRTLIGKLGDGKFLVLYFGSLLAGSLLTHVYHKRELYYSAVGASGAVSGVVYGSILLYPNMSLFLFPLPIPIPAYIFGIGYLLYSMYGMKNQLGNVGHSAHLGGAIGGYVLMLLLYPKVFSQSTTTVLLLGIPILLLLLFGEKLKK